MDRKTRIELQHISVAYGRKTVLRDVNLIVRPNDFLGIIGPNGGGKTTLIKTILGLIRPVEGRIVFYKGEQETSRPVMGYLPQYNQIDKRFPISIYDVVLSGLNSEKRLWQRFSREQHNRVNEMIHRMGLSELARQPIGQLSGGQMQRALLGRAIVSQPDVLILDEPNTYIDKQFEEQLYRLLEEINRTTAIILVSHDIGSVLQNVKAVACVNETLHYHPDTEITGDWLDRQFGCPIELLGHGQVPHRVLKIHNHR